MAKVKIDLDIPIDDLAVVERKVDHLLSATRGRDAISVSTLSCVQSHIKTAIAELTTYQRRVSKLATIEATKGLKHVH